jgi:hypothetical protein
VRQAEGVAYHAYAIGAGFFCRNRVERATRDACPNMAQEWGKLGGRPKKLALRELMGQESK